jgi:hypothetical protein
LLRNLTELSIKAGIIVRSPAALEHSGGARPVKEPGCDSQCTNLIPGNPSRANFVYFASHASSLLYDRSDRKLL